MNAGTLVGTFISPRLGEVQVYRGHYLEADGPLAVYLVADGPHGAEVVATLSVNMTRPQCSADSRDLPPSCFYLKAWGENEHIASECFEAGIITLRPDLGPSTTTRTNGSPPNGLSRPNAYHRFRPILKTPRATVR